LFCFGQEVSQATYAALYSVLSTTYNTGGEAVGNFRLPDLRGRSVFGRDNMGGTTASRITNSGTDNSGIAGTTLGATGGDQRMHQHTHTQNAHTHTQNAHNHTQNAHSHNMDGPWANQAQAANQAGGTWGSAFGANNNRGSGSTTASNNNTTATNDNTTATNNNTGTGGSQNMPPAIILNYIIKT
jgi:microcystin-dependent protein